MPWSTTRKTGTAAKYRSREHREYCAALKRALKDQGHLICTAQPCVFSTRIITNPNGNDRDGLTAGHNDDGVTYAGPQHRACNVKDGARRGNARARGKDVTRLQW